MSRIWSIAREPKKHLANQVIAWTRYEKYCLLAALLFAFLVYGALVGWLLHEPVRKWLGW